MNLFNDQGAIFSKDNRHRYLLWRTWANDAERPLLAFIGLNPSVADANEDDPTIRRCIGFAKQWGYRGFYMANLFSLVTPFPSVLKTSPDKLRKWTDYYLKLMVSPLFDVVFCWGALEHAEMIYRAETVINMFPEAKCLTWTKEGHPGHPLYLKADTTTKNFFPRRLNDEQVLALCQFELDAGFPDRDKLNDFAEKMDMERDDENNLYIDHEGLYDKHKPEIVRY